MKKVLQKIIQNSNNQMIPYDEFIQHALYDRENGYYQGKKDKFGKEGDFYTASMVHQVYSEVLANIFYHLSHALKLPLQIVEMGGGNGRHLLQLVKAFQNKNPVPVKYIFIEKNNDVHHSLLPHVPSNWQFQHFTSVDAYLSSIQSFEGIVFSNEFLDAQPVKVVVKRGGAIKELFIALNGQGDFVEIEKECSDKLAEWLVAYAPALREGQRFEVPLYMSSLLDHWSKRIKRGVMITVDYGYHKEEWQHQSRKDGSLRGYYRHTLKNNILEHVGEMDITHHVQWDLWERLSKKFGFSYVELMKQERFLREIGGIFTFLENNTALDPFSETAKRNRAIRTLIAGEWMGVAFDVCVQAKGLDPLMVQEVLYQKEKKPLG